jgi:hypothetical protein
MKFLCNQCAKFFLENDITIHYKTGDNGFEIVVICPSCLENYLDKVKLTNGIKDDEDERMKMKRKW